MSGFLDSRGHKRNTHGHYARDRPSPTFYSWAGMINRCTNQNQDAYKNYGGRGISVCERWRKFANFLADMGERPEGKTIDRINNDGNYEPGNCRWATRSQQRINQRPSTMKRGPRRDWSGERVGKLTVLRLAHFNSHSCWWLCRCDCGSVTEIRQAALRDRIGHCGCLTSEHLSKAVKEAWRRKQNARL